MKRLEDHYNKEVIKDMSFEDFKKIYKGHLFKIDAMKAFKELGGKEKKIKIKEKKEKEG